MLAQTISACGIYILFCSWAIKHLQDSPQNTQGNLIILLKPPTTLWAGGHIASRLCTKTAVIAVKGRHGMVST